MLMIWAIAIMANKGVGALKEHRLLEMDLVPVSEGTRILPEDAREYAQQIQSLPDAEQRFLLPHSLLSALHRFRATQNIQQDRNRHPHVANARQQRSEDSILNDLAVNG